MEWFDTPILLLTKDAANVAAAQALVLSPLNPALRSVRTSASLTCPRSLCGTTHFNAKAGRGFLHVVRRGELVLTHRLRSGVPR